MHPIAIAICPDIKRLHRVSRINAKQAAHGRDTLSYYRTHSDVDPYTPIVQLRNNVVIAAERESEALMLLNYRLLESGLEPGQSVEIADHTYRVRTPGTTAQFLGVVPPSSEIEMDREPEGEPSADEVAEWNRDYAISTHWEG
jgi:hypothetical protein